MANNTYVALDTKTVVGTTTAAVEFTSIPQGYTDLRLVINTLGSSLNNQDVLLYVGTGGTIDTTNSNYSETALRGNGTTATSVRYSAPYINSAAQYQTNSNYIHTVDFMNYSNSTTYKTYISRGNNAAGETNAIVLLWRNTGAITNVRFTTGSGSIYINAGSTFTLYGIKAASVGAKATGGTIYQDSSYFYHVFSGNGTFTPSQSLTADVLSVAGGGGTSVVASGGGGAGGVLYSASASFSNGVAYTCTVGSGGAGINNRDIVGGNGTNSTITGSGFTTLTAVGGGGGAGYPNSGNAAGGNGGSGGGGSGSTGGTGGTATSGQGFAGGVGDPTSGVGTGGGGGGAGVAGGNGSLGFSGSGGNGTIAYNSWLSTTGIGQNVSGTYYIAGGGSGGAYNTSVARAAGYGGGGQGSAGTGSTPGANGLANTGGGAGGTGGYTGATGANGGSGVIIVRYAK